MFKKTLVVLAILSALFSMMITTKAYDKTHIYYFYAEGCITCAAEDKYLIELEAKDPNIVIHKYEIAFDKEN
ncbi:MAG: Uncharacterized protein FD133_1072, partial [Erysipelotrichaceae bacterium]